MLDECGTDLYRGASNPDKSIVLTERPARALRSTHSLAPQLRWGPDAVVRKPQPKVARVDK